MRFIRATVVGGALFLVPIVVLAGIFGRAHAFFQKLAAPIAETFPTVAGIPTPRIVAIFAIVVFCFLAGLYARTDLAKRSIAWLESAILSIIPGYSFMKSIGENIAGVEGSTRDVVLVSIEDAWQIGFLIERIPEGQVAVFVPDAPNPWSGSVFLMGEDRIKTLDVPAAAAMKCIKGLGLGSGKLTQGRL